MKIVNFMATSSASANGVEKNFATAVIQDEQGNFAPNINVVLTLSGDAKFDDGAQTKIVKSNVLGLVEVGFVDTTTESVIVTIMIENDMTTSQSAVSSFIANTGEVDSISSLIITDGEVADGVATNEVKIQTFSGAIPIPNIDISASLSNGAVFINGESTAVFKTNSSGIASLIFTNNISGSVILTAYKTENVTIYTQVETHFTSIVTDFIIDLEIVANNAIPNGQAVNIIKGTVRNVDTLIPTPGINVLFSVVEGEAQFVSGQLGITDENGEVFTSLSDLVEEDVVVKATAGDKSENITINFNEEDEPLKILRVFNKNKEFVGGTPSVAWRGAEFIIEAAGGSGYYEWAVTKGSDTLSISNSSNNQVILNFSATANSTDGEKEYVVSLKDGDAIIDYVFVIDTFFMRFGTWEIFFYDNRNEYPSIEQLLTLYNEWGNMTAYEEWFEDADGGGYYWTNSTYSGAADAVNLKNGSVDQIEWFFSECGDARFR